jgi:2-polyprenyl-6-methoxyphenol hydroxylase-like FAD-dependent oxidoreductase
MADQERCEVAVVGAGPVGLLLAARLAQLDLDVRLLEQRPVPSGRTRAVGIHPPSLERLEALGVLEPLRATGVPICRGWAHGAKGQLLGGIKFQRFHPCVLSVGQPTTERVLVERLAELLPGALQRGRQVTQVRQEGGWAYLDWQASGAEQTGAPGAQGELQARFVVLADGHDSALRTSLGVGWEGGPCGHHYLMGDFPDESGLGPDAHIFLTRAGLVESLPLPEGGRRWVVRTEERLAEPGTATLRELIQQRLGRDPGPLPWQPVSSFSAASYLASSMVVGHVLLAGDAAQVLSPIGGQGMNFGWLGAWELAGRLRLILRSQQTPGRVLEDWSERRRELAQVAARRAGFNMAMGATWRWPWLRDQVMRGLLLPPMSWHLARQFSMKGL